MKLSNMSLAAKLWMALGVVIGLLAFILIVSSLRGAALSARLDADAADRIIKAREFSRWVGLTETNTTRTTASLMSSDPVVTSFFKDPIAKGLQEISELRQGILAMNNSEETKVLIARSVQEGGHCSGVHCQGDPDQGRRRPGGCPQGTQWRADAGGQHLPRYLAGNHGVAGQGV